MDIPNQTNRTVATIKIDKKACIGAATCVVLAPEAFEINSDGIAEVKSTALNHTDEELINAAKSCPTLAITLFDVNGNEIKL